MTEDFKRSKGSKVSPSSYLHILTTSQLTTSQLNTSYEICLAIQAKVKKGEIGDFNIIFASLDGVESAWLLRVVCEESLLPMGWDLTPKDDAR